MILGNESHYLHERRRQRHVDPTCAQSLDRSDDGHYLRSSSISRNPTIVNVVVSMVIATFPFHRRLFSYYVSGWFVPRDANRIHCSA